MDEDLFKKASSKLQSIRLACLARAHYIKIEYEPIPYDDIEKLFHKAIELDKNNKYAHNWYGTFLKEVKKDFVNAEIEYNKAIEIAKSDKNIMYQKNSLFLNNMALLIIDKVQLGFSQHKELDMAIKLLEEAIQYTDTYGWSIPWPQINLEKAKRLKREILQEREEIMNSH